MDSSVQLQLAKGISWLKAQLQTLLIFLQVLIQNHTSGVNYLDVYLREGVFTLPTIPAILGVEGAGIVEKLGPGAVGVTVDDRVAYFHFGSG